MRLIDKDQMFLRLATIDVDGCDSVSRVSVSTYCNPIIEFNDGDKVEFDWQTLIDIAIRFKEEERGL